MSIPPFAIDLITGPFGGGSTKPGFLDSDSFGMVNSSPTDDLAEWHSTANTGTNPITHVGGQMVMTLQATANADLQIQRHHAQHLPATNIDLFWEARLKIDDVSTSIIAIGLHEIDTDVTNTLDHGAFFEMQGADANLDCVTGDGTTHVAIDSGVDLLDDTFFTVGIKVLGTTKAEFYVNGILKVTRTVTLPTAALSPTFALSTTGSAAEIMTLDWMRSSRQDSDSL